MRKTPSPGVRLLLSQASVQPSTLREPSSARAPQIQHRDCFARRSALARRWRFGDVEATRRHTVAGERSVTDWLVRLPMVLARIAAEDVSGPGTASRPRTARRWEGAIPSSSLHPGVPLPPSADSASLVRPVWPALRVRRTHEIAAGGPRAVLIAGTPVLATGILARHQNGSRCCPGSIDHTY